MASFSFDVGNARKLAAIPLYLIGRLATALIPRSRDRWVFGSAVGIGDGALAVWREAAADAVPAVWLTGSPAQSAAAAAHGIRTVPRGSLRGWWHTARARVIVITHGFGDVNRYAVSGAFVVQLWHGIPLKRIGLDSPETTRPPAILRYGIVGRITRRTLALMYRAGMRRIGLIPAASATVRGRLESAFGLDDTRVPVTGEPRVDVLSAGTPARRRSDARAELGRLTGAIDEQTVVALYAPTWRDGESDPAIPDRAQWRALIDVLEHRGILLLIRSHPLGVGDYHPPEPTDRVCALGSDLVGDITPLLGGVDVLITDYSSLVYDSALVPVPVIFLAPDETAYARSRGFYGRYRDVAGDEVATDWYGAAAQLDMIVADPAEAARRRALAAGLSETVHSYRDGRNASRVYRSISVGARLGKGNR